MKTSGKLEIHVPQSFTSERPAVRYSSVIHDTSIDEHPLASRLPTATDVPSVHPGPLFFRSLGIRSDAPTTIYDYLRSDEPQLSLHIVVFKDATLVSLSWPHTMMDAMGRHALVSAWCKVLDGHEEEVPSLLGAGEDALDRVVPGPLPDEKEEPYSLSEKRLSGFKILILFARSILDFFRMPGMELQTIFLPAKVAQLLVQETRDGLADDDIPDKAAFVSEGDVLAAWATRIAASSLPSETTRSVVAVNAFDLRSRLKSDFASAGVYVQNFILYVFVIQPARRIMEGPLAGVASVFRQAIAKQTTEAQVRAMARVFRDSYKATRHGPLFGDTDSYIIWFSNWTKGKFFDVVDFSSAVIKDGGGDAPSIRSTPAGKPTYYHCQTLKTYPSSCCIFNILGKDAQGNYWMTAHLPGAGWRRIDEEFKHKRWYYD